jgi:hypothetical protein
LAYWSATPEVHLYDRSEVVSGRAICSVDLFEASTITNSCPIGLCCSEGRCLTLGKPLRELVGSRLTGLEPVPIVCRRNMGCWGPKYGCRSPVRLLRLRPHRFHTGVQEKHGAQHGRDPTIDWAQTET